MLRNEVLWLLQRVGVAAEDLACLSDFAALPFAHHSLVDQNAGDIAALPLWYVYDHHEAVSRRTPRFGGAVRRVASTCTLVAPLLLEASAMPGEIAEMLLFAIAFDTSGFDPAFGTATPEDARVNEQLERLVQGGAGAQQRAETIAGLIAQRTHTPEQLLRADFKRFGSYGIASMPVAVSSLDAGQLMAACGGLLREERLDFLLLCSLVAERRGSYRRQLGFFVPAAEQRVLGFEHPSVGGVVGRTTDGSGATLEVRTVADGGLSRKVLQPLFERFIRGHQ